MAGITDLPFRLLCRESGAGLVVSEMVAADPRTWHTRKSSLRTEFGEESSPRSVQIAGYDPDMMAAAAKYNVSRGAEIVDINMGCPAKKVCRRDAGSALLKNPKLVKAILEAVTTAVKTPVTLKIRTGWDSMNRNAQVIAKIAEDAGVAAIAIHGRTRQCRFAGTAEYDTIAKVVSSVNIPVIANGDITTPQKARSVLNKTGAAGIMIGRAALGNPWIFQRLNHYLRTGELLPEPLISQKADTIEKHLRKAHDFYGETSGVKIVRKHIAWYLKQYPVGRVFVRNFNTLDSAIKQRRALSDFFNSNYYIRDRAA